MKTSQKKNKRLRLANFRLFKKKFHIFLLTCIVFSCLIVSSALVSAYSTNNQQVLGVTTSDLKEKITATILQPTISISISQSTPTEQPAPTKIQISITKTASPTPSQKPRIDNSHQYNAEQIDETTWKVKNVENDERMASASEILAALNGYRTSHGLPPVTQDQKLTEYAQERASNFNTTNSLDGHAGFKSYMDNGGFDKAGFNSLGENSAMLSGNMGGEKIIKNIFGADPSHDGNQLDNWTHAGVGIAGNYVNINFGKNKK